MRVALLGLILLIAAVLIAGCAPQMTTVKSGVEVICSNCNKVISSNVATKSVPVAEASKYSVQTLKELCDDCQRIEDEKKRAEEARQAMGRVAGRWLWVLGLGTWELNLREDGTGTLKGDKVSWQPVEGGFTGTVEWARGQQSGPTKHYRSPISGTMHSNGQKMTIHGYGFFGFGSDQSCEMERAD